MEQTIFENLLLNSVYTSKVFHHLFKEYFPLKKDQVVFDLIASYHAKYHVMPTKDALKLNLGDDKTLPEAVFTETFNYIEEFADSSSHNMDFLVDKTEEYCKERALYNAVNASIDIIQDEGKAKGGITDLLSSALAVSFDNSVGLDYKSSIDELWEYYTKEESKIKFGLETFDRITRGGLRKKTLTVFMASTGGGKTIMMCHLAAQQMMAGKNVLYVSCEMSEEMLAQRIDANLMKVDVDKLAGLSFEEYASKKRARVKSATGRLIIKEYPTATATSNHIRSLLNELKLKQGFVPDVVMVDYLNICASSRLKSSDAGSHNYPKAIAEEMRGLAIERDFACVTATQMNRSGYRDGEPDLTHTSESMGLPVTADMFFALSTADELETLGQIRVTQLKNRFGDITRPKQFVIGLDRPKMTFYDCEDSAQDDILQQGLSHTTANSPNKASNARGFT